MEENLTGKIITFQSRHGLAIAKVTSHNDKDILTIHTAVMADTLKPLRFTWGGRTIHKNEVKILNL